MIIDHDVLVITPLVNFTITPSLGLYDVQIIHWGSENINSNNWWFETDYHDLNLDNSSNFINTVLAQVLTV